MMAEQKETHGISILRGIAIISPRKTLRNIGLINLMTRSKLSFGHGNAPTPVVLPSHNFARLSARRPT
jgi:hypothetical protein